MGFFKDNQKSLSQNLFLNSFIILLFVSASKVIFPIVSDSILLTIVKSKFIELTKFFYPYIKLDKLVKNKYAGVDIKPDKKKREKKNGKFISSKIIMIQIILAICMFIGFGFYVFSLKKSKEPISIPLIISENILILLIMCSSFLTEVFILKGIYMKYPYVPGISLLSNLINIIKNSIINNSHIIQEGINDIKIDYSKLDEKDIEKINKQFSSISKLLENKSNQSIGDRLSFDKNKMLDTISLSDKNKIFDNISVSDIKSTLFDDKLSDTMSQMDDKRSDTMSQMDDKRSDTMSQMDDKLSDTMSQMDDRRLKLSGINQKLESNLNEVTHFNPNYIDVIRNNFDTIPKSIQTASQVYNIKKRISNDD